MILKSDKAKKTIIHPFVLVYGRKCLLWNLKIDVRCVELFIKM